jgi:ABC-type sulfate/molybdate transport systems ATPase subunit
VTAVLDVAALVKAYGALRPLRLERLTLHAGEHIALMGLDQPAAEILISLITGASLPDQGDVLLWGASTRTIADSTDWLAALDRFGIVSDRAALLDPLTVVQNLALPFTLEIEPPSDEIRAQAEALARDVGLEAGAGTRAAGTLSPPQRLRLRLARALALNPTLLLIEHPSASLARADVKATAVAFREIVKRRGVTALTLTMDQEYASGAADRVLTLDPATGRLAERKSGRLRFWS